MTTDSKDFTPQQSLELIRSMIETTKLSISNRSNYLLLWGWATILSCICQYILLVVVKFKYPIFGWSVLNIALIIHSAIAFRDKESGKVKNFIIESIRSVCLIIGFSFIVLNPFLVKIGYQYSFPFCLLLFAIGTLITGRLINFKPLIAGGTICFVLVAIIPYLSFQNQILTAAFAVLISYIIPVQMLRNYYKR